MEVRFRPLQPSTLARRLSPGQPASEQGQSFFEVVESLTGAANNAEENANSNQKQNSPSHPRTSHPPTSEPSVGTDTEAEKSAESPKSKTEEKPLGIRIDITA